MAEFLKETPKLAASSFSFSFHLHTPKFKLNGKTAKASVNNPQIRSLQLCDKLLSKCIKF